MSKWLGCLGSGGDELNLAGVLNVLDGVVDSPGRIVIMTSNHPEKLDPALIRPGRINKQLYLGAMSAHQAARMAAHHYPGAGEEALAALERAVPGDLVPARLEALCAEHEELDDLISALAMMCTQGACGVGAGFAQLACPAAAPAVDDVDSVDDVAGQARSECQASDVSARTAAIEQGDVLQVEVVAGCG